MPVLEEIKEIQVGLPAGLDGWASLQVSDTSRGLVLGSHEKTHDKRKSRDWKFPEIKNFSTGKYEQVIKGKDSGCKTHLQRQELHCNSKTRDPYSHEVLMVRFL